MSSIIACSSPPLAVDARAPGAGCCRARSCPCDWASRRAGSMVSTTTLRPRSAARSAERRRGRGLADAAGAAADDDPGRRVVEQRVDVERAAGGARARRARRRSARSPARAAARRSVVQRRRGRRRSAAAAARSVGGRAPASVGPLLALQRDRSACSAASAAAPRRARRRGRAARPRRAPAAARLRRPRSRPTATASFQRAGLRAAAAAATMFTMTPPTGRPAARSSATPSAVSCTGISSSSVTRCTAVCGDVARAITRVGLRLWIGPDPGQPGDLGVDVEEAGDAAGRRRVHDDRVVRPSGPSGPCGGRPRSTLPVSSTSRRPGAMVVAKSIAPSFCRARPALPQVVEHLEVVQQRLLGVDRQRVHLAAAGRDGDLPLLVGQRAARRRAARCPAGPRPRRAATFRPPAARASASAAATVVLPVPPLPVTTCSRTSGQSVT